jgi:hypothetical protein
VVKPGALAAFRNWPDEKADRTRLPESAGYARRV